MADSTGDTVRLTDLEVIQQFSLAVRGATASRGAVIAALESDLAFLRSSKAAAAKPAAKPAPADPVTDEPEALDEPVKAPAKKAAKAPAKKAPAKKATRASGA